MQAGYLCYARPVPPVELRLAEVLGALSLACDVAYGFPLEKAMRSCVLSVQLGRRHGLSEETLNDAYYTSLLSYLGCTAFAHDAARASAGEDIAMHNAMFNMFADPSPGRFPRLLGRIGKGTPLVERARGIARFLADPGAQTRYDRAICEVSVRLSGLVGVSEAVRAALDQLCATWDGRSGEPSGEAISILMRLDAIARFAEIAHHRNGRAAAVALVKKQRGRHFDPALAATFLRDADELLATIEGDSIWERFLAGEPGRCARVSASGIDDVAKAFAQLADLKSVWTLGHSSGVAAIATKAAEASGLGEDERDVLRRAALLHDLGRVSAPLRIWDKPSTLSASDWEIVRMHSYWTERVLSQSPLLREAAQLASAAHERLDGTGYHRAMPSPMLGKAARILAAADAYHAMREPRPYRPARTAGEAIELLRADISAGRLDRDAVHAVLDAAGLDAPRSRATWPCGLTDREVTVLRLVARGQSNNEIGATLGISPRTAQHHVQHIYAKIGTSSRAAAALFATDNQLLET
jgi:response regulator RpfG family c-di-GMP phosphodiesterase/DNA-binding CsgD family transcriptional regulator